MRVLVAGFVAVSTALQVRRLRKDPGDPDELPMDWVPKELPARHNPVSLYHDELKNNKGVMYSQAQTYMTPVPNEADLRDLSLGTEPDFDKMTKDANVLITHLQTQADLFKEEQRKITDSEKDFERLFVENSAAVGKADGTRWSDEEPRKGRIGQIKFWRGGRPGYVTVRKVQFVFMKPDPSNPSSTTLVKVDGHERMGQLDTPSTPHHDRMQPTSQDLTINEGENMVIVRGQADRDGPVSQIEIWLAREDGKPYVAKEDPQAASKVKSPLDGPYPQADLSIDLKQRRFMAGDPTDGKVERDEYFEFYNKINEQYMPIIGLAGRFSNTSPSLKTLEVQWSMKYKNKLIADMKAKDKADLRRLELALERIDFTIDNLNERKRLWRERQVSWRNTNKLIEDLNGLRHQSNAMQDIPLPYDPKTAGSLAKREIKNGYYADSSSMW